MSDEMDDFTYYTQVHDLPPCPYGGNHLAMDCQCDPPEEEDPEITGLISDTAALLDALKKSRKALVPKTKTPTKKPRKVERPFMNRQDDRGLKPRTR